MKKTEHGNVIHLKNGGFDFVDLQPRSIDEYEEKHPKMQELIHSIETKGLAQYPLAIPNPEKEGRFLIVAGRRRTTACLDFLGWEQMPCIFHNLSLREAMQIAFEENTVRSDTHPVDNALFLYRANIQFGEESIMEMKTEFGERNLRRYLKVGLLMNMLTEKQRQAIKKKVTSFNQLREIEGVRPSDDSKILMKRVVEKLNDKQKKKVEKKKEVETSQIGNIAIETNIGPRATTIKLKCDQETGETVAEIVKQYVENPKLKLQKPGLIARIFGR